MNSAVPTWAAPSAAPAWPACRGDVWTLTAVTDRGGLQVQVCVLQSLCFGVRGQTCRKLPWDFDFGILREAERLGMMICRKWEEKVSNNVWCYLIFEEGVINICSEKCGRRDIKRDNSLDGEVICDFPYLHFCIF